MSEQSLVARCVILLLVFLTLNAQGRQQDTGSPNRRASGDSHFASGKKLIDANCIDCMGGTQAGMEQGIGEVETALKEGYQDRKAAYELLADAYGEMVTYTGKSQDVSKSYDARRVGLDRKLFELYPEDPAVLDRYQATLTNVTERIEILRRLLRIKQTPVTQFELGYLLMEKQNAKEGLPLIRDAIKAEHDPEAILNYATKLMGRLKEGGCPLAAEALWQQKAQAAFYKATSGEGRPQAMAGFQQQFVAALERVNCKNI